MADELVFMIGGVQYPFDAQRLMFQEAVAVKKQLRMSMTEFGQAVQAEDVEAIGFMAWLAIRRKDGPTAVGPFADFDFDLGEVLEALNAENDDEAVESAPVDAAGE